MCILGSFVLKYSESFKKHLGFCFVLTAFAQVTQPRVSLHIHSFPSFNFFYDGISKGSWTVCVKMVKNMNYFYFINQVFFFTKQ